MPRIHVFSQFLSASGCDENAIFFSAESETVTKLLYPFQNYCTRKQKFVKNDKPAVSEPKKKKKRNRSSVGL